MLDISQISILRVELPSNIFYTITWAVPYYIQSPCIGCLHTTAGKLKITIASYMYKRFYSVVVVNGLEAKRSEDSFQHCSDPTD